VGNPAGIKENWAADVPYVKLRKMYQTNTSAKWGFVWRILKGEWKGKSLKESKEQAHSNQSASQPKSVDLLGCGCLVREG
jgi:hypothetical protein